MTAAGAAFLLVDGLALMAVPRHWGAVPLILGACYMTRGQAIEVGPFTFPMTRLLIVVGLIRIAVRREWHISSLNGMDQIVIAWGCWLILSVAFHLDPLQQGVLRLGMVYDALGFYLLFRVLCRTCEDLERMCRGLALVTAPIAVSMIYERTTQHNVFSALGGVAAVPETRNGTVRAQGPFLHAILAGNVGAVSLPLFVAVWPQRRKIAFLGLVASAVMLYTCGSTGPLLSAAAGVVALCMWPWRQHMRRIRLCAALLLLCLALLMKAPVYYIMARIDLTGGSTGWHRSYLLESSIKHLSEWWLVGTDYTRHWMPTGVPWSLAHTDVTNHYLRMGVLGGAPLLLLFVGTLIAGYSYVGQCQQRSLSSATSRFVVWAYGSALLAHSASCLAVSYFDQSILFLYMTLAGLSSAVVAARGSPGLDRTLLAAAPSPFGRLARCSRLGQPDLCSKGTAESGRTTGPSTDNQPPRGPLPRRPRRA